MINRVLIPEIECTVYLNQETRVDKNKENEESLDLNSKIKKLQKQDEFIRKLIENLQKKNKRVSFWKTEFFSSYAKERIRKYINN
jgi:hypothetical protein